MLLKAVFTALCFQQPPELSQTPEWIAFQSKLRSASTVSLLIDATALGTYREPSGHIALSKGGKLVLDFRKERIYWDGKQGSAFSRYSNNRTRLTAAPNLGQTILFGVNPGGYEGFLAEYRLSPISIGTATGKPSQLTGWRLSESGGDYLRSYEFLFDPTTQLLVRVVEQGGGTGQPYYCSYALTWSFNKGLTQNHFQPKPFDKSDLISLEFMYGSREPRRDVPYGYSRIQVRSPKGLRTNLEIKGGVNNALRVKGTVSEKFSLDVRPGALVIYVNDANFIASFREGEETIINLGGIRNRTGKALAVEDSEGRAVSTIGVGKTIAIMSGTWHVKYASTRRKIAVKPLRILDIGKL